MSHEYTFQSFARVLGEQTLRHKNTRSFLQRQKSVQRSQLETGVLVLCHASEMTAIYIELVLIVLINPHYNKLVPEISTHSSGFKFFEWVSHSTSRIWNSRKLCQSTAWFDCTLREFGIQRTTLRHCMHSSESLLASRDSNNTQSPRKSTLCPPLIPDWR